MPATRLFAMLFGIVYLLVGIAGFIPPFVSAPPPDAPSLAVGAGHGLLFGLFPVNAIHSIIHLAVGVWGVVASRAFDAAKIFARGLAIVFGVLTVMGFFPVLNTTFGLAPLHGHDIWLHALTAIAGAYFGWFHQEARQRAATGEAYAGSKPEDRL